MHAHHSLRACAAYTLTELLIVVAILAVAAVVAIPAAQPVAEFGADAAAGEVVHALRFARESAQHSGVERLLVCDAAANTITVFGLATKGDATTASPDPVVHPFTHLPYQLVVNTAPAGNQMALVRCTFTYVDNPGAASVGFDTSGNPVRGVGTGPARTKALRSGQVVLGSGNVVRTIDIDTTGRITVS
jgi:prepilin-type N-terminal cleavage/methylation domain-containing protein